MDKQTKVIAIANQKGGVGKTTTVVNLAAALSARRRTVLVVDLDPQAHATLGLGLEKRQGVSMYSVLTGAAAIADVIQPTKWPNLNVIPSEVDLAGAELEFGMREDRLTMIRDALKPVKESGAFDYIILDCPPSLSVLTVNAMTASDSVLVPIQCEYYALEGLSQLIHTINLVRERLNPKLDIEGIVFTMYDARTNLSSQVVENVRANVEQRIYNTLIPRNIRLAEAPSYGEPITIYEPKSAGAEAYRKLAKEMLGE